MIRKTLRDLKVDEYIHPIEKKIRLEEGSVVAKGLDLIGDINLSLIKRITLGCDVEATEENFPRLIHILKDVCRILDYHNSFPRVYISHAASQSFYIAGGNKTQIVLSDYIADQFTNGMLYYSFGNLVSMAKAGHLRLANASAMMFMTPQAELFRLPIQALLRAADLTSDRGGLLACQRFGDAARCILWEAGIPISDMVDISESQMIHLAEKYVDACEWMSEEWLTSLAKTWIKLNMQIMPPPYRMRELLEWYKNGNYAEILESN